MLKGITKNKNFKQKYKNKSVVKPVPGISLNKIDGNISANRVYKPYSLKNKKMYRYIGILTSPYSNFNNKCKTVEQLRVKKKKKTSQQFKDDEQFL